MTLDYDWVAPCSAVAAFTLHAISVYVSPLLCPGLYEPLSRQQRQDWHGRIVGSLYATVISSLALPEYLHPGAELVRGAGSAHAAHPREPFTPPLAWCPRSFAQCCALWLAQVADPTFGTSLRAQIALSIAAGFFVWDVAFCVCCRQGAPFVAHSCSCLFRARSS